jgi:hypothetical protein
VVRLLHAGVRRKDGRFATGVLHLWHEKEDRSDLPQNEMKLGHILATDHTRAVEGLSRLDGPMHGEPGAERQTQPGVAG